MLSMKSPIIFAVLLLVTAGLQAGGFQVNLQGVQQTGMAHTGAGLAIDASAQLFNPGGLAMARSSAVAGFMPIFGRVSYAEPAPGTYATANEPTMATPFAAYGAGRFRLGPDHRLALGLAVYTPFGSRVLYADDWKGQFALREISVRAIYKQATVAYSFQDRFGIGASFIHANGNVSLRKAIPAQFADGSYGEARLSGAGSGLGFTVGGFAKLGDRLGIGLNYRSKVVFQADGGTAEFSVPDALAEYFPNTTFSSSLPLPSTTTLGLAYHYKTQDDVVCVDVNYVGWSAYQSLAFDFQDNTEKLLDSDSPRNYHNSIVLRAGWQMRASELLLVRAGAQLDLTPVPDGHLTPETPDATKLGLSAGASLDLGQFRADAAFLWIEGQRREGGSDELNFYGSYKARAFIPSIGIAWLFNDNRQEAQTEHL
jgi:long-chain fatty acid transport protein